MRVDAEKVIATLVVLSFTLSLMGTLIVAGNSLTKEEAIEISRNSQLVQSLLEDADRYTLEVHYLNQTQVNKAREEYPSLQEFYPKDRSVWTVTWYIHPMGATSAFAYVVGHIIDAETGQILHEGWLSAR